MRACVICHEKWPCRESGAHQSGVAGRIAALEQRAEQAERERDAALEAKAKHEKNANEVLEADAETIGTLTKERDEALAKVERYEKALRAIVTRGEQKRLDYNDACVILDIARAALEDK